MIILNRSKNAVIANKAQMADTFPSRMTGLLKHKELAQNEALIITRCNSIHMFFMKFAIDVIFINKANKVVGLVKNIQPNHLSPIYWSATKAIELPVGIISSTHTELGDDILFE
ncbi:MAG: DUF192 domain-containing protein [Candidatus Omnitrophica bacterium]|nr:DUF192 domain-containing protein [Candidatus Omnitrophota bacterium]